MKEKRGIKLVLVVALAFILICFLISFAFAAEANQNKKSFFCRIPVFSKLPGCNTDENACCNDKCELSLVSDENSYEEKSDDSKDIYVRYIESDTIKAEVVESQENENQEGELGSAGVFIATTPLVPAQTIPPDSQTPTTQQNIPPKIIKQYDFCSTCKRVHFPAIYLIRETPLTIEFAIYMKSDDNSNFVIKIFNLLANNPNRLTKFETINSFKPEGITARLDMPELNVINEIPVPSEGNIRFNVQSPQDNTPYNQKTGTITIETSTSMGSANNLKIERTIIIHVYAKDKINVCPVKIVGLGESCGPGIAECAQCYVCESPELSFGFSASQGDPYKPSELSYVGEKSFGAVFMGAKCRIGYHGQDCITEKGGAGVCRITSASDVKCIGKGECRVDTDCPRQFIGIVCGSWIGNRNPKFYTDNNLNKDSLIYVKINHPCIQGECVRQIVEGPSERWPWDCSDKGGCVYIPTRKNNNEDLERSNNALRQLLAKCAKS